MKGLKILLLLLCSNFLLATFAAPPQTCPAEASTGCGDASDEWEGEFFPGIPNIKYEGPSSKNHLAYKWYNAEEEILGKKMKDYFFFIYMCLRCNCI
ncbi:xylose isomerase [Ranunculus cassubicifolius]